MKTQEQIRTVPEAESPATSPGRIDFDPPLLQSLSVLCKLSGKPVSTDSLKAGLPHEGEKTTVNACLRALNQHGFTANTVHRPKLDDISPLTLPCILLLEKNNTCVLQELSGTEATVIFPETPGTSRKVPTERLQESFTGYALFAQPQGHLDSRSSHLTFKESRPWFWGNIGRFWPIYRHVILATLAVNLLALASPLFVMNVYDRVVPNNAVETLWVLATGVLIAFLFEFILRNLRGFFVDTAGKNADVIIASRLMQQLMAIRLDQKPESTGSLANNLREFESLREFFSSTSLLALIDLPFIALFIAIIAFIGGPIALVPAIAVPLVILVGYGLQFPFRKVVESGFKEATQKNALLVEIISGLEAIKTSLADGQMQKRWEQVVGMSARSSGKARTLATFSISFAQFSSQVVSVGIIIWGVYRISAGELTLGGLIACSILVGRAMAPLGAVAALLTRLQQSRMALRALDTLMDVPGERDHLKDYVQQEHLQSSITLAHVHFKYPNSDAMALHSVNIQIKAGEKVGIIGRVGSGKSTLGRLMMGLYQPSQGAVKVGGVDIQQLDIADLRRKIGYVAQDTYLFYGSVRDNIVLGNPFVDDRTLLRAAAVSGVADFIKSHPAGFGLQVGERGQALSGGQRQAVAIARTLLQDPDILILDEPTNSMDNSTETLFRQRLAGMIEDKTLLLITHRSSMLPLVNRLIVIDQGHIVADGPKDQVLEALQNEQVRGPQGSSRRPI